MPGESRLAAHPSGMSNEMDVARMSSARLLSSRRALAGTAAFVIAVLGGCASDEVPYEERAVEQIYNKAMGHSISWIWRPPRNDRY